MTSHRSSTSTWINSPAGIHPSPPGTASTPTTISGLRLHSGEWTIDQAAAFFERGAHLPAAQGSRFNLREFHERVMTNGIAPWWAHRQLLLPDDASPVIE